MIRASICVLLVLLSTLATFPTGPNSVLQYPTPNLAHHSVPIAFLHDPNGTKDAFNATYSQFDLYANTTSTASGTGTGGNLTWFSTQKNSTGAPILRTAFIFSTPGNTSIVQGINWTLTIPKGNFSAPTFLRFHWNGTAPVGTSAAFRIFNASMPATPVFGVMNKTATTFTGGPPVNSTGAIPIPCRTNDECYDVTKFIGFDLILAFIFKSNATGGKLAVRVQDVMVASVGTSKVASSSHAMLLNPSNSTEVLHIGKLSLTYDSTVTYPKPHSTGQFLVHKWNSTLVSFYIPASYTITNITLNGFDIYTGAYPIGQGPCTATGCKSSVFLALNMTAPRDAVVNAVTYVNTKSINAVASLDTRLTGVQTDFWIPGERMGVSANNQQGVNATGEQNTWFTDPFGIGPIGKTTQSTAAKKGNALYNATLPTAPLGKWTVTIDFLSGYDYGYKSHEIQIEKIHLNSNTFTLSGSNAALTAGGILGYESNSTTKAANVNATVFAVDQGSTPGPIFTLGTASSTGLYITNITIVNGVFTTSQPLTLYFTIKNPTTQALNASITIDHEWYPRVSHGVNATLRLVDLGDEGFTAYPVFAYRADIRLTDNGVQVTVHNLQTNNKISVKLSLGSSAVPDTRQHFGLFKFTVRSTKLNTQTPAATQSVESPPYAYVLSSQLIPSRLLSYSPTVTTATDGGFTTTTNSAHILAAKKLELLVLARDANGIVLALDPTATTDNTLILPSVDMPAEVTTNQAFDITLHLNNNSTQLAMILTVNLDLDGPSNFATQTKSVIVGSGQTIAVTFRGIRAPSAAGPYTAIFSSPEYGSPFLSKSLRVSVVPPTLQMLVPALIGLIVALIILGVYVVRRRPEPEEQGKEKTKPASGRPQKPQPGSSSSKPLTRS